GGSVVRGRGRHALRADRRGRHPVVARGGPVLPEAFIPPAPGIYGLRGGVPGAHPPPAAVAGNGGLAGNPGCGLSRRPGTAPRGDPRAIAGVTRPRGPAPDGPARRVRPACRYCSLGLLLCRSESRSVFLSRLRASAPLRLMPVWLARQISTKRMSAISSPRSRPSSDFLKLWSP